MAKTPLPSSLLRLKSQTAEAEAVALFKLVSHSVTVCCVCIVMKFIILTQVMRFMTDHSLGGIKEMVLGNYIIQKVEYVLSS